MVAGFEIPTKGEIWISDEMVNDVPPNKRDTTMVFKVMRYSLICRWSKTWVSGWN